MASSLNKKDSRGPFDIIGDIHGCFSELTELLEKLGYEEIERFNNSSLSGGPVYAHPQRRIAFFVGDFVDRGPQSLNVLRLVHNMLKVGSGLAVIGNHDEKFLRKLRGRNVQIKHGLEKTLAELNELPLSVQKRFSEDAKNFLASLPFYAVAHGGQLVIAHAGIKEKMIGRFSEKIKDFTLYGQTTGQNDEYGLPIREDWTKNYAGSALIVYGHTPVPEPYWSNNTLNIDTGCIFGGKLSALRYPEREIISVKAKETYYRSPKPFLEE